MQLSKATTTLLVLLAASVLAFPASTGDEHAAARGAEPDEDLFVVAPGQDYDQDAKSPFEPAKGISKRGFGCPRDRYECDRHCRNDLKLRGGYCGGHWWLGHPTCICIRK